MVVISPISVGMIVVVVVVVVVVVGFLQSLYESVPEMEASRPNATLISVSKG